MPQKTCHILLHPQVFIVVTVVDGQSTSHSVYRNTTTSRVSLLYHALHECIQYWESAGYKTTVTLA